MRKINEDISKREYKRVYLLYGEQDYLKKQYKDKLREAVTEGNDMNYGYFEGKRIDVGSLIEMSETLPFFADYRLIVVENSGFFKGANDTLAEYIGRIPDTTVIVFVEEEVDKRTKLYKQVKANGYECEMSEKSPAVLEKWILDIINRNNKKITKEAADYFLSVSGTDMMNISRELEKLICYCMDREVIGIDDVRTVATEQISARIFDMIDAMGNKNQKRALEIYYDLIASKEPPMRILFMLSRQFNIMLQIKELSNSGFAQKDIASRLSLQPFVVGKALKQSGNFSMDDLGEAIAAAVDMERRIKSGNMQDKTGVEMLLIKYSEK